MSGCLRGKRNSLALFLFFFLFPFFFLQCIAQDDLSSESPPPPPLPKISTVLLLSHTQTQIHHGCGNHHKHSRNGSPHLTPFRNPGCPIFYCNFPITRRYLPALVPSVRMKFDRLLSDMSSHFGLWVSRTDPKSLFSVCVCSCQCESFLEEIIL